MSKQHPKTLRPGAGLLAAALLAFGGCARQAPPPGAAAPAPPPAAQPEAAAPAPIVEQAALDRLKAMAEKLAAAKALSFRAHSSVEAPSRTGQFVTHFVDSEVFLQRPGKLRANVQGDDAGFQLFYDGASVTALEPAKNFYAATPAPATLDEMLPFLEDKAGIEFPSSDLMVADPYAALTKDLTHAVTVGKAHVNGVPVEHFAFMGPAANWEIWIGADALPRRVAVTYKTVPNFPRFQVEYLDWNLKPKLDPSLFVFKKPAGAKPIEFSPATPAE